MMMTVKIGIDRRSKVDGVIEGAGARVNINMYKFLVISTKRRSESCNVNNEWILKFW